MFTNNDDHLASYLPRWSYLLQSRGLQHFIPLGDKRSVELVLQHTKRLPLDRMKRPTNQHCDTTQDTWWTTSQSTRHDMTHALSCLYSTYLTTALNALDDGGKNLTVVLLTRKKKKERKKKSRIQDRKWQQFNEHPVPLLEKAPQSFIGFFFFFHVEPENWDEPTKSTKIPERKR